MYIVYVRSSPCEINRSSWNGTNWSVNDIGAAAALTSCCSDHFQLISQYSSSADHRARLCYGHVPILVLKSELQLHCGVHTGNTFGNVLRKNTTEPRDARLDWSVQTQTHLLSWHNANTSHIECLCCVRTDSGAATRTVFFIQRLRK